MERIRGIFKKKYMSRSQSTHKENGTEETMRKNSREHVQIHRERKHITKQIRNIFRKNRSHANSTNTERIELENPTGSTHILANATNTSRNLLQEPIGCTPGESIENITVAGRTQLNKPIGSTQVQNEHMENWVRKVVNRFEKFVSHGTHTRHETDTKGNILTNPAKRNTQEINRAPGKHIEMNLQDTKIGSLNQSFLNCQPSLNPESKAYVREALDNIELPVTTFTGRETELKHIKQLFQNHTVVVLVGMGGLGKTQIARKFALDNADMYTDRLWIEAETTEKFLRSFDLLSIKLNVQPNNDIETVRDTFKSLTTGAALIIFDNVEHAKNIYKYLPTRIKLTGITIHVLITSRCGDWTNEVKSYKLPLLDTTTAFQLFKNCLDISNMVENKDYWLELAEILGCLPLALQVAASYIRRRSRINSNLPIILVDYITKLKQGRDQILNNSIEDYEKASIYLSMMLSVQELEKEEDSVLAVRIINVAAYMDPDNITSEDLMKLIDGSDKEYKLDNALVIIIEFSLMNKNVGAHGTESYSMHRIIQMSIRYNQTLNERADKYYMRALDVALNSRHKNHYVFQYAEKRATCVLKYYYNNPSSYILKYLVKYGYYNALKVLFETNDHEHIKSIISHERLLYFAVVVCQNLEMCHLLYDYGANPSEVNEWGRTLLHEACINGNTDIVEWLLQKQVSPNARDGDDNSAIHFATKHGDKLLALLLNNNRGAVFNVNNKGRTPLIHVLFDSTVDEECLISAIRTLIYFGASVNKTDIYGWTALHFAASHGCAEAALLILQSNEEVIDLQTNEGRTALLIIAGAPRSRLDDNVVTSTVRVLIKYGASVRNKSYYDCTAMHGLARNARANAVALLLQSDKYLKNVVDNFGQTAMHVVGENVDNDEYAVTATIRVLLENDVSLHTINNYGLTPNDTIKKNYRHILEKLVLYDTPTNKKKINNNNKILLL